MAVTKRTILAVTGARSEYDLLYPVLEALRSDPDRYEVSLVVTGAHLSERYGLTRQAVEADGFRIADYLFNLLDTSAKMGRMMSLANQLPGIAQAIYREAPDMVFAIGDREEAITTTLASAYLDVPCAHFYGGDMAKDGNIDNSTRYAASKYAHLHFTAHPQHNTVLERLGEEPWRIHHVGNIGLDRMLFVAAMTQSDLAQQLHMPGLAAGPFALVIYHPIITQAEAEYGHTKSLLQALQELNLPIVINSPNSDAGYGQILEAFSEYAEAPNFYFFKNLPREQYINLLRHATVMVGNSSSGLLEAPSFDLPVVNVGPRQRGRLYSNNVEFVDYDVPAIKAAVQRALTDEVYREAIRETPNPYGDGQAAKRVKAILDGSIWQQPLLHKNITYEWQPYS